MTTNTRPPIAEFLYQIVHHDSPLLLATFPSSYAILNPNQPAPITGCCMLIPKVIVPSPNELTHQDRAQFFLEMTILGDAIMEATGSLRINYLVLCNQAPELHGHCIPRFDTEDPVRRKQCPFTAYDFADSRSSVPRGRDQALVTRLQQALQTRLSE